MSLAALANLRQRSRSYGSQSSRCHQRLRCHRETRRRRGRTSGGHDLDQRGRHRKIGAPDFSRRKAFRCSPPRLKLSKRCGPPRWDTGPAGPLRDASSSTARPASGIWHALASPDQGVDQLKATGNLRAAQILLGHAKIESISRYLAFDVEDALELAERTRFGSRLSNNDM